MGSRRILSDSQGLRHRRAEGLGRRPGTLCPAALSAPEPGWCSSSPRYPGNRPSSQGAESLSEHRGSGARPPRPSPGAQHLFLDLPLTLLHSHFFQHLRSRPEGPSPSRQVNQDWGRA